MKSYRDLRFWKSSVDFAEKIYRHTARFPADERFGLIAQMRRVAVSIPSNVAEGQGRITTGEWIQFVGQARGSLYELQTQILIAEQLGYIDADLRTSLFTETESIARDLSGFIRFLRRKRAKKSIASDEAPATNYQPPTT